MFFLMLAYYEVNRYVFVLSTVPDERMCGFCFELIFKYEAVIRVCVIVVSMMVDGWLLS